MWGYFEYLYLGILNLFFFINHTFKILIHLTLKHLEVGYDSFQVC